MMRNRLLASLLAVGMLQGWTSAQQNAKPADEDTLPSPETVVRTGKDYNEAQKRLEDLRRKLEILGDLTKRQPGESAGAYIARAEEGFKTRAVYVHYVHQEIEKLLEAKYAMQDAFQGYEGWIKNAGKSLANRQGRYQQDLERLGKERDALSSELVLLADRAKKQAEEENDKASATEFGQLYDPAWLGQIPGASAEQDRLHRTYPNLQSKRERIESLNEQITDRQLEIDYLQAVGLPETEKLAQSLPEAHKEVFTKLSETLEKNKDQLKALEFMATRVSVTARIAADNLRVITPEALRRARIDEGTIARLQQSQELIEANLKSFDQITGGAAVRPAAFTGDNMKQLLQRRFAKAPSGR